MFSGIYLESFIIPSARMPRLYSYYVFARDRINLRMIVSQKTMTLYACKRHAAAEL